MTDKQIKILEAALRLFATEGYAGTSTSKVAKEAGVSEGLIFRHFGNKEGLLNAILEKSHEEAKSILAEIVLTTEPKELIRKTLEMPFSIDPSNYEMWRLTYALKWQTNGYQSAYQESLKLSLKNAFEKLNYDDPEAEVELLLMYLDGAATAFLLHEPENKTAILTAIKNKYKL